MIIQPWQEPWKGNSDTNLSISQRRPFQIRGGSGFLKNQLEKVKLVPNLVTYTTGNLNRQRYKSNKQDTEVLEGNTWRTTGEKCLYTCGKRFHPPARGGELRTPPDRPRAGETTCKPSAPFDFWLHALEKEMATHSSVLVPPGTGEPGGLQSMGSLRVGYDWATSLSLFTFMHWRRKWQPTPVFLPGESQGWGSLVGCHLWGRRVGHDWSDLAVAVHALMTSSNVVKMQD